MRKPNPATSALTVALLASGSALAQAPTPRGAVAPASAPSASASADEDAPKVYGNGAELPAPADPNQTPQAKVVLPTGPIEPYLLTKANGPFMVLAHTFRGPEAPRVAMALTQELRDKFHLPAYIWYMKVQPGRSNIRGVPPTADNHLVGAEKAIAHPRNFDEAAVLVGDCKSLEESLKLLHDVKKLHPVTLDGVPHILDIRKGKGLSRAMMTTNPMRAGQELYPGKAAFDPSVAIANFQGAPRAVDPLLKKMNDGPHSVLACPGPYTLVVADYSGDSVPVVGDPNLLPSQVTRGQNRLVKAAENAEAIVNALAKDDTLKKTGYKAYVFHDRSSSKVTLGAFQSPDDPKARELTRVVVEQMKGMVKTKGVGTRGNPRPNDDIFFLAPNPTLLAVPAH